MTLRKRITIKSIRQLLFASVIWFIAGGIQSCVAIQIVEVKILTSKSQTEPSASKTSQIKSKDQENRFREYERSEMRSRVH